ncbi:hypothetical protein [Lonepinella sp. BR2474]|uniref:hypothetical protein n=1 Tax=Lonepinella sp. BR2474 TaxID=3434548 RepID=UPI003F6DA896
MSSQKISSISLFWIFIVVIYSITILIQMYFHPSSILDIVILTLNSLFISSCFKYFTHARNYEFYKKQIKKEECKLLKGLCRFLACCYKNKITKFIYGIISCLSLYLFNQIIFSIFINPIHSCYEFLEHLKYLFKWDIFIPFILGLIYIYCDDWIYNLFKEYEKEIKEREKLVELSKDKEELQSFTIVELIKLRENFKDKNIELESTDEIIIEKLYDLEEELACSSMRTSTIKEKITKNTKGESKFLVDEIKIINERVINILHKLSSKSK